MAALGHLLTMLDRRVSPASGFLVGCAVGLVVVLVAGIGPFAGTERAFAGTAPVTVEPVAAPGVRADLPTGKGIWIWQPSQSSGGNVDAIVNRATRHGLTHLYVRTGSSWDGFENAGFLATLLPQAHKVGLKVYGWDFPKLEDPGADVDRAARAIALRAPGGHRLDGFAADIETRAEGTQISAETAVAYGSALRRAAGADYPLIAVVPRPSPARAAFPYAAVIAEFDAVAPMVYWLDREPGPDVAGALRDLASFDKPVFPIGQAYDGGPEGGRRGVPPREELHAFMSVAHARGAAGVSFWSWQAADDQAWLAIRDGRWFTPEVPALPR